MASSILLVRHGPVAQKASGLLSFEGFCAYIEAYELSGIDDGAPPPALARLIGAAKTVFASDAPRAMESAARLGVAATATEAAFREAPPRAPRLPLRLPALAWLALARLRGAYDPGLEAERRNLSQRAEACAHRLIGVAEEHPVALVGHGWFNRHAARALAAEGWRKSEGAGFGAPWGYVVFAPKFISAQGYRSATGAA